MSETSRRSEPSGGVPPTAVLALAVPVILVCLVLLIGPFYDDGQRPFRLLRVRLEMLLGDHLPRGATSLLHEDFFMVLMLFCVLLLGVIPYQSAKRAHAVRRREQAGATGRRAERGTAGTAGAESVATTDVPTLTIGVEELRGRASRAGIPWDSAYETAGGARALLEILRELRRDPVEPGGDATSDSNGAGAGRESSAVPAGPVGADELAPGAAPVIPVPVAPHGAEPDAVEPDGAEPEPAAALETSESPASQPPAEPAWTPTYSGSVYTSTTLYSSERLEGQDATDEEGER